MAKDDKRRKSKRVMVPLTLRVPIEVKDELEDLAERMPGEHSLNSVLVSLVQQSLPLMRETVRVMEMVQNAPNPSLVVEQLEAFVDGAKRDANTFAGLMNTARRGVAAQEEAQEAAE